MKKNTILLAALFLSQSAQGWAKPDPYQELATTISSKADRLSNKRIALIPFAWTDGQIDNASNLIAERLLTRIVKIGNLEVVERTLLDKVLSELKLGTTGVLSTESAKELGKVLGVSAIVTGTLADLGKVAEINVRLIETETGKVLIADSLQVKKDWMEETETPRRKTTHYERERKATYAFSLDIFQADGAYKKDIDDVAVDARFFRNTLGYASDSTAYEISTGAGLRFTALFPLSDEGNSSIGGSIGMISGPTDDTEHNLKDSLWGPGAAKGHWETSFFRVLFEAQKSMPLSERTTFDLGAGLGLASAKMIFEATFTGSLVNVWGVSPKRGFTESWSGFTWEVSPAFTYHGDRLNWSFGLRYAGFPTKKKTNNLNEFKWTPLGVFIGIGW